jgi:hypothetical protein
MYAIDAANNTPCRMVYLLMVAKTIQYDLDQFGARIDQSQINFLISAFKASARSGRVRA